MSDGEGPTAADLTPGALLAQREGASAFVVAGVAVAEDKVPRAGGLLGRVGAVFARFSRHRGSLLAGGLSFFAMLSIVPALIALGALATVLVDPEEFLDRLVDLLSGYEDANSQLIPIVESIFATLVPTGGGGFPLAGLVSFAVAIYAASRFVYVGRQVLDVALENQPKPPSFVGRLVAILITLTLTVVAVLSVLLLTALPAVLDSLRLSQVVPEIERNLQIPITALVWYLLLTVAMRYGTDERRAIGWLNMGAVIGTVMVLLGSAGLGFFLSHSTTYGAAVAVLGSVVALELWLYILALALVIAAEYEAVRLGL